MKTEVTISDYIKSEYKKYAIHTLTSRGIPSFEDCLTPIQRIILKNAPDEFQPTLSLFGKCSMDGYIHGDASIVKSASRLCRDTDVSVNFLEGYGFFGNKMNPLPSAPRYTSLKINKSIKGIISEYSFLNKKEDGKYLPFNVKIPIGLGLTSIGIGVGFKSLILPRKFKDIIDFLDGKRKTCNPYFKCYNGTISKIKDIDNGWLFEGEHKIDESKKTIHITSLPPLMNYSSFLLKLDKLYEDFQFDVINMSTTDVNILIKCKQDWEDLKKQVIKIIKQIVKESIVFVKDDRIIEYSCIEDYLLDIKNKNHMIDYNKILYDILIYTKEIEFLDAKEKFFDFMLGKKRTEDEVDFFLKQFKVEIIDRLENIKAKRLNKTELLSLISMRKEYKNKIIDLNLEKNKLEVEINNLDFTLHNKIMVYDKLFESEDNYNDIEFYEINETDLIEKNYDE